MKRSISAFVLAVVMVVSLVGCGSSKKLQSFESELYTLRDSSFYDLALKKDEIEGIIHNEKASIFNGNSNWEHVEDGILESYDGIFTVAGRKWTVSASITAGKVLSVSYTRNNCTESEEQDIYNTIVEIYGEPDESEIRDGYKEGFIEGIDSFKWKDEQGFVSINMYYSHDLQELHFS